MNNIIILLILALLLSSPFVKAESNDLAWQLDTENSVSFNCTLKGEHKANNTQTIDNLLNLRHSGPDTLVNASPKHLFSSYKWDGSSWVGQKGKYLEKLTFSGPQKINSKLFVNRKGKSLYGVDKSKIENESFVLFATADCTSHSI